MRYGGFGRNETFDLAVLNDRLWSAADTTVCAQAISTYIVRRVLASSQAFDLGLGALGKRIKATTIR